MYSPSRSTVGIGNIGGISDRRTIGGGQPTTMMIMNDLNLNRRSEVFSDD
jgi:hypothetical protein